MNKQISPRLKRCQDCVNLRKVKGEWCCDECFNQKCEDIDDCPDGYTIEEVEALQDKKVKLKLNAKAETTKSKGGATKGPRKDEDKQALIQVIVGGLTDTVDDLEVVNIGKIITFTYNGNRYKLDLIKTKK